MSASTNTSKRKIAYIHIGLTKTGSKWIQKIFSFNAERLRQQGITYPLPEGEEEGSSSVNTFCTNAEMMFFPDVSVDSFLKKDEISQVQSILLSAEVIFSTLSQGVKKNKEKIENDIVDILKMGFHEIRFLLICRATIDRNISQYGEQIKQGFIKEMPNYELLKKFSPGQLFRNVCTVAEFLQAQPGCSLTLVNYDAIKNNMLTPLEQWLQLPTGVLEKPPLPRINRSLSYAESYIITHITGPARELIPRITFEWIRQLPDLKVEKMYPSVSAQEELWSKTEPLVHRINQMLPPDQQMHKIIYPAFQTPEKLTLYPKQIDILLQILTENYPNHKELSTLPPQQPAEHTPSFFVLTFLKRVLRKIRSFLK